MESRLQVLWIEDNAERFAIKLSMLNAWEDRCFRVRAVGDLEQLLDFRPCSERTEYPDFDVAVCDFNLVGGQLIDREAQAAGLGARAAGLMIGVLLALREPGRPRAIVPYSGSPEEFGDNWLLLKNYLPSAVVLADEFDADKLEKPMVFASASAAFRTSIERLAQQVLVHFSDDTVRWFLAVAEDPAALSDRHREIEIVYSGGIRRMPAAALFYREELLDSGESASSNMAAAIRDFVGRIDLQNPDLKAARSLAAEYWHRSTSEQSIEAYERGSADVEPGGVAERGRWLIKEQYNNWVKSFAALELCIRAYVEQVSVPEALDLAWLKIENASAVDINAVHDLVLADADGSARSFFSDCLLSLLEEQREAGVTDFETLMDRLSGLDTSPNRLESWEERWVRAVDPVPRRGQATRTVNAREMIGRGLSRYFTERVGAPDNAGAAKGIIQGAPVLPPALAMMAKRFAYELIPPRLTKPQFVTSTVLAA